MSSISSEIRDNFLKDVMANNIESIKNKLDKRIIEDREKILALEYAVTNGKNDLIQLLLDHGVDINTKYNDNEYATLLILASQSGSYETVKLLLNRGANINDVNFKGFSALMAASRYSNTTSSYEIVKLLLDRGANINEKTKSGKTSF
jgi:ankyrin repeat protein